MSISGQECAISEFVVYKSGNKSLPSTAGPIRQGRQGKVCTCIQPFQIQQPNSELFSCTDCAINLRRVSQLKKDNVIIQYENAKLKEQIEQLRSENEHLKQCISSEIAVKINAESNSTHYLSIKQDLQAELFQCKIINQMLMIGQYPKSEDGLKEKYEQIVLEKLILHEQLEQKNRIINDKVFYPIYHYDSRLRNLKDAVSYLYRMATKECKKTQQLIKTLRKEAQSSKQQIKKQIGTLICTYSKNADKQNKQNIHTHNTDIQFSHSRSSNKLGDETYQTNQRFQDLIEQKQVLSSINKFKPQSSKSKKKKKDGKSKVKPKQQVSNKTNTAKTRQEKNLRLCCIKRSA